MDNESYQYMTIGHVAMRGTKEKLSSPFLAESDSGERVEQILKNGGFLERERSTSRFPGFRTVGSPRAKKQSCSKRQGLPVGTGFVEFQKLQEVGFSPTCFNPCLRAL